MCNSFYICNSCKYVHKMQLFLQLFFHMQRFFSRAALLQLLFSQCNSWTQKKIFHYISARQHGFVPGKSVQSNLLEYINFIVESIWNGGQIDAIVTDFWKDFDKVKGGVKGVHRSWFQSYLVNRTQYVVIGSTKSKEIKPSSGIQQGSILGPLLFLIYVNNLA